ncbi:hypothetical protein EH220_02600 [bacterium]|nr:MAG: hypothetical protein EH220_02600 [bacterium]
MKHDEIFNHPIIWPLKATFLCFLWALLFWFLFINLFSWRVLHIPMGLGGTVYYVFFTAPVIVGSGLYQFVVNPIVRRRGASLAERILFTLLLPFVLIAILMIVFCPMDTNSSYLEYVVRNFLLK